MKCSNVVKGKYNEKSFSATIGLQVNSSVLRGFMIFRGAPSEPYKYSLLSLAR